MPLSINSVVVNMKCKTTRPRGNKPQGDIMTNWLKKFLPIIFILLILSGCDPAVFSDAPLAEKGILDLRGFDLRNKEPMSLEGEWNFYWNRFLLKDDLKEEKADLFAEVPEIWNDYEIDGKKLPGTGFATYQLHVKTELPEGTMLGFRIYPLSSAYRLYVDDELIASNGTAAESRKEEVGEYRPQAVTFAAPAEEFDVILHVSNHATATGGFWYRLYFGEEESVLALDNKLMAKETFLLGVLAITLLFYLMLFFLFRKLKSNLYFAILCLFMALSLDMVGQYTVSNWISNIPLEELIYLWYTSIDAVFFFLILYLHELFRTKYSKVVAGVYFVFVMLCQILYLTTDPLFYTRFADINNVVSAASALLALSIIIAGIKKGYRDGWLNMISVFVLLLSSVHDLLLPLTNQRVNSSGETLYFAVFLMVVLQILIQSKRIKEYYDGQTAAELSFLQAQIKPHFLFNSLNTFIAISRYDMDKARDLLIDFSNYLRRSFDIKEMSQFVPLKNEIELAQAYASIEKARFDERLEVTFEVPEKQEIMVPTMILQPLIENAIVHGILPKPEGGKVEVMISEEKNRLSCTVKDNGIGIKSAMSEFTATKEYGKGIGLLNIDNRLRKLYGQGLSIKSEKNKGTEIAWTIPIRNKGERKR